MAGREKPFIRRYALPILFVLSLGAALSTALSYFHTKRSLEEMALAQMSQSLWFIDREINTRVRSIEANVAVWGQEEVFRLALHDSYLGRSAREAVARRLTERVSLHGYSRAFLARADGRPAAASDPGMVEAINVRDRDYFKRSLAGRPALETVSAGLYTGWPVLVASVPLAAKGQGVEGVLVLATDVSLVARDILDGIRIGRTGGVIAIDEKGGVLAAPSWRRDREFEGALRVADRLRAAGTGHVQRYKGFWGDRLCMGVVNSSTGWLLAGVVDEAELLRPAARIAAVNGLIAAGGLALVMIALAMLRKAIAGLRASESRYRTLAETTPVGIVTFDAQGRPEFMNRHVQEILGLGRPDAQSPPWTERFRTREGWPLPLEELPMGRVGRESCAVIDRTVWYEGPGGEKKVLSLSAAPFDGVSCASSGVVATLVDVTERARIQEMMIQTEKMLSVGGLAAGMAHEINNPLASVLQALQVVQRRLRPGLAPNEAQAARSGVDLAALADYTRARGIDEFLEAINEAGIRAARIVSNMLGFVRKSGGDFHQCRLDELLDRTVELAGGDYDLKKQYDFRRIEIVREYAPDLPAVTCQPMEIEQVFFNILKNAAQALKEMPGEHPDRRIVLRTRAEGEMAVAEIEDNGPGMSEEIRKRAFEPFYTTKSIGAGTGLGLSVAYFIVNENHKGGISVASEPGKGARFSVRLPFTRAA